MSNLRVDEPGRATWILIERMRNARGAYQELTIPVFQYTNKECGQLAKALNADDYYYNESFAAELTLEGTFSSRPTPLGLLRAFVVF